MRCQEKSITFWLQKVRQNKKKIPFSSSIVRFQASNFYELMKARVDFSAEFLTSAGWLDLFEQPHNIKHWKMVGEVASVHRKLWKKVAKSFRNFLEMGIWIKFTNGVAGKIKIQKQMTLVKFRPLIYSIKSSEKIRKF